MTQVSLEALQAMYAQETGEVFLPRLTLTHADLDHPIRVVADSIPMIVGSDTVADMTGNGHDGAVNGAPTWVRSLVDAGMGSALAFVGNDADYVFTPAIDVGDTWTVECPFRPAVIGAAQIAWSFGTVRLTLTADGVFRLWWTNSVGTTISIDESVGGREAGRTYHIAARHEGTETVLFIDGEEVGRNDVEDSEALNRALYIGRHSNPGYAASGALDELRIWSRARTGDEIARDQASGIDASSPGLVAYYPMNDGCFLPYPFDITAPDDISDQLPQVTLRIDNVDRRIVRKLRDLDSPPTVTMEVVLASSPSTIEHGPFAMTLRKADYTALSISGTLAFRDLLNMRFPKDTMTPSNCAGLF